MESRNLFDDVVNYFIKKTRGDLIHAPMMSGASVGRTRVLTHRGTGQQIEVFEHFLGSQGPTGEMTRTRIRRSGMRATFCRGLPPEDSPGPDVSECEAPVGDLAEMLRQWNEDCVGVIAQGGQGGQFP